MKILEIESKINVDAYDGEDFYIINEDRSEDEEIAEDVGIEVRLWKWDKKKIRYSLFNEWKDYVGKKVKLTIELIDE